MAKHIQSEIINWEVIHPDGHNYILPKLDHFLSVHDKTKEEMESLGWKFFPRTTK